MTKNRYKENKEDISMAIKIAVSSMTNADSFIKEGPYTAMEKLKNLGVTSVEISQHIQFNSETIPEFLRAQKDFEMDICALSTRFSGTVPMALPKMDHGGIELKTYSAETDFDQLVELCEMFDCHYVRFASLPGRQMLDMNSVQEYMKSAEEMACRFEEKGIHFCAHNHADEFIRLNGKTIFDWSLELAPHLYYEVDVLNVQKAGVNPVDLLLKCKERAALLHMQDQRIKPGEPDEPFLHGPEQFQGVEIGEGVMDMKAITDAAKKAGSRYLIIEQGRFYGRDPYDSIGISVKALKHMI